MEISDNRITTLRRMLEVLAVTRNVGLSKDGAVTLAHGYTVTWAHGTDSRLDVKITKDGKTRHRLVIFRARDGEWYPDTLEIVGLGVYPLIKSFMWGLPWDWSHLRHAALSEACRMARDIQALSMGVHPYRLPPMLPRKVNYAPLPEACKN